MNSVPNIDINKITPPLQMTANFAYEGESEKQFSNLTRSLHNTLAGAGLAFVLCFTTPTTMIDPWVMERRRRDAVVTMSIYKTIIGRAITRTEALMLASQILKRAEQERLAYAEIEAASGIQWE